MKKLIISLAFLSVVAAAILYKTNICEIIIIDWGACTPFDTTIERFEEEIDEASSVKLSLYDQIQLRRLLKENASDKFEVDSNSGVDVRCRIILNNGFSPSDTIYADRFQYIYKHKIYQYSRETAKYLIKPCDDTWYVYVDERMREMLSR